MRERRKAPRYPLGIPGKLHQARGSPGQEVVVLHISVLGCALDHADGPSPGKKCELYFDWQDVLIGMEAQVVWKDAQGRIGLRFHSVDKDTQQRLNALCVSLRNRSFGARRSEDAEQTNSSPAAAQRYDAGSTTVKPSPEAAATSPISGGKTTGERERRRVPRYVSDLRTHLSHPATGTEWKVTLVTLSILGGCAEGSGLPQPGQQYELTMEWEGHNLHAEAVIVWKGKEQVGFQFAPLNADAEQLVRKICSNLRLQPLTHIPPDPS